MKNDPSVDFDGLNEAEIEKSRHVYGSNDITKMRSHSFFKQLLASFGDPIIKILLIALFANVLFMFKDFNWHETAGIAIAVLLATFVSTLSEYGSETAFEKLQQEAARINCRVKRYGGIVNLPVGEIVVGDLILLQAGERIPADGRIVYGELNIDQSALNGEFIEKRKWVDKSGASGKIKSADDVFGSSEKLFRGSIVCSGEGIMIVESVGDKTFYGRLAIEVQEDKIESPLKSRLSDLARTISSFGYIAAVVVFFANLFNNVVLDNHFDNALIAEYISNTSFIVRDIMKALTLGITVIVMAVPEGLPMMITVVLSANMRRMLKDNVLVRKLVGIETSGSLNILFTDKTGTLTKGKLDVSTFLDSSGQEVKSLSKLRKMRIYKQILLNCYYNNGAQVSSNEKGQPCAIGGNSTDRALLEYVINETDEIPDYDKGFVMPFNSSEKLSVTEIRKKGKLSGVYLIKGAPENLLPFCKYSYDPDGDGTKKQFDISVMKRINEISGQSVRFLALCEAEDAFDPKHLQGLTLVGFLGLKDELRIEARQAVNEVQNAGVQVVMITGDNKETAAAIARDAGIITDINNSGVLTSSELNSMSDSELKRSLSDIRVVARALPSDKSRLVRISQEMGLVAGMTGDGVNDAPALRRADVGFAMGDGTEIAKEAGDIVILDNNFSSISKAILYGRTIFKSIRKFIIFQLTVNLCAVAISVIAPFIGIETPITVIQMLWINIIMDTLAGLAYAGEPPLPEYMNEPPKSRDEKIINRYMISQILSTGVYTTILCLLFLKLPMFKIIFRAEEHYIMTAFFALFIFSGIFNSFSARTHRLNLSSNLVKNKAFVIIMGMVALIQMFMIYYGGTVFRTSGLRLMEFIVVMILSFTVVLADLFRKILLRANNRKGFI